MTATTLYGARYSVYVRIARLVLEEAGVPYDLVDVDIFSPSARPSGYSERHPFDKIPAFEHDGFRLFETDAIAQYAIAAFGAGHLLPAGPRERARALQIMRIMDNYAYPALVWGVFVEEVERGRAGNLAADEIARAETVLDVIDGLAAGAFLAGERMTLADLWALPVIALFQLAPTGRELMARHPRLVAWRDAMETRASVAATRFPREIADGGA
jgi:glutathione S-transferase